MLFDKVVYRLKIALVHAFVIISPDLHHHSVFDKNTVCFGFSESGVRLVFKNDPIFTPEKTVGNPLVEAVHKAFVFIALKVKLRKSGQISVFVFGKGLFFG